MRSESSSRSPELNVPVDPTLEPLVFAAADGRMLAGELVHPLTEPRAALVLHGATAVPRRYYVPFAKFLAAHGILTLIYDYRGVGGSALARAKDDGATMSDWLALDAPAAVRVLVARAPELPLLAIGHSFGGQIAAALEGVPAPRAIATMGAQRGYWAAFPLHERPLVFAKLYGLLPGVTSLVGYLPGSVGLGVDMPSGIVREWAGWCRRPDYYLGDHPEVGARLASFRGRLFAMSVTDDDFAPLANVTWLLDRHERAAIEHVRFSPRDVGAKAFGHFGFFRAAYAGSVWREALGFFDEALGEGTRPRAFGELLAGAPRERLDELALEADLEYGRA